MSMTKSSSKTLKVFIVEKLNGLSFTINNEKQVN
jgi:hypothetical protein